MTEDELAAAYALTEALLREAAASGVVVEAFPLPAVTEEEHRRASGSTCVRRGFEAGTDLQHTDDRSG